MTGAAGVTGVAGGVGTLGGLERLEGRDKVTGAARYAFETPAEGTVYGWAVQSTVPHGRIRSVDAASALAQPGVLAVLDHTNAAGLRPVGDPELFILQSPEVHYRGQVVAAVVAASPEAAREAAGLVRVSYEQVPHKAELDPEDEDVYTPDSVNGGFAAVHGDAQAVKTALADSPVRVETTYTTPAEHPLPMEPHAALAAWDGEDRLTVHYSDQGPFMTANALAPLFDLPEDGVRVLAEHVGGGFGSKANPRSVPVLAAMAARLVRRPVKLALTRQQMFALVGHRTPTVQRVRLGADREGRLLALDHDAVQQTSRFKEYVEQTAVASRVMYGAPQRHTRHRVLPLHVPSPSWMRAPGDTPGMFALESAMDELAVAAGVDPVELRLRNEPETDPESGAPFSSRNLAACLREGAARFGWAERDPRPGVRREGRWLVGTGVAASTHPDFANPAVASVRAGPDGRFTVRVCASDIGTGARTVLTQLAAEELGVPTGAVTLRLGDSAIGQAPYAGGSAGTASWGWAVLKAIGLLRDEIERRHGGTVPDGGVEVSADTTEDVAARPEVSRHAFGAQFAEVRVDAATGEIRVDRLHGTFAAGRILNARTGRSQFLGGMVMGLGMALLETAEMDPRFGDFANHDYATYHVPTSADVRDLRADWIEEHDDRLNATGAKGVGEIGIVGTAAAIANAVYHATGFRARELPVRLERMRAGLPR